MRRCTTHWLARTGIIAPTCTERGCAAPAVPTWLAPCSSPSSACTHIHHVPLADPPPLHVLRSTHIHHVPLADPPPLHVYISIAFPLPLLRLCRALALTVHIHHRMYIALPPWLSSAALLYQQRVSLPSPARLLHPTRLTAPPTRLTAPLLHGSSPKVNKAHGSSPARLLACTTTRLHGSSPARLLA